MSMHEMLPFRLNDYSLITEKAGKDSNGFYTECAKSWLINPLIAYAVLIREEAGLFFAPLPTDRDLKNVGHQLRDVKAYPRAIRDLINKSRCAIYPQDIQRLQGFNYLYFSPALQNRIFQSLEHNYPPLSEALLIFSMEKFQWEREIFMHSQQQRAQSLLSCPAPAKAPPAPQPAAQPHPPAPTTRDSEPVSTSKNRGKDKLMGPESDHPSMCNIRALINNAHEEQGFTKCSHNILTMQISTATPVLSNLFVYSVYPNKEANQFYHFLPSRQTFNQSRYPNFNTVTLCNSIFELLTMENSLTFGKDDFQYSEPHQHFELAPNFETRLKLALEDHDEYLFASFK